MTIAQIIIAALRAPDLEDALVDVGVRVLTRVRDALPAPPATTPSLLTRAALAKRLGVSVAHIRRLDPPSVCLGDASTRRYDLDAVRAFLAARAPSATTPAKRTKGDDVDVSSSLARAGIRRNA